MYLRNRPRAASVLLAFRALKDAVHLQVQSTGARVDAEIRDVEKSAFILMMCAPGRDCTDCYYLFNFDTISM